LARDDRDPEREGDEPVRGEVLEDVVDVRGAHGVLREDRHERKRDDQEREDRERREIGGVQPARAGRLAAHRLRSRRFVRTTTTTTMIPGMRVRPPAALAPSVAE